MTSEVLHLKLSPVCNRIDMHQLLGKKPGDSLELTLLYIVRLLGIRNKSS